jgi:hypothetical protein
MRSQLFCLVSDLEVVIFSTMTTTLDTVRRNATMCEVCLGYRFTFYRILNFVRDRHVVSSRNMLIQVEHNTLIVVARVLGLE